MAGLFKWLKRAKKAQKAMRVGSAGLDLFDGITDGIDSLTDAKDAGEELLEILSENRGDDYGDSERTFDGSGRGVGRYREEGRKEEET